MALPPFKEYLPLLKELQEIDTHLKKVEIELAAIPGQLESSGGDYLELARALKEKETAVQQMTTERQSLEEALKRDTVLAQEREKRLFAIKTQKEYQATLKEVAELKKDNKDKENRILALLESAEKISQEITQLKSQTADKEGAYRQVEAELKKKQEELTAQQLQITNRKPALLKELPSEVLKKYEFVKRRYTNAVAVVKKGVCQGCHMNIPSQFYNEMLKAADLRHCPHCHRLIYPELDPAGKSP